LFLRGGAFGQIFGDEFLPLDHGVWDRVLQEVVEAAGFEVDPEGGVGGPGDLGRRCVLVSFWTMYVFSSSMYEKETGLTGARVCRKPAINSGMCFRSLSGSFMLKFFPKHKSPRMSKTK
jgi:hypothetical protein